MNYALIFAGGTGQRMNTKTRPKQFLELYGKPIILYTIEAFEDHPAIDGIVVVCLEEWMPFLRKKIAHYDIAKVIDVVPGGTTGQESIRQWPCGIGGGRGARSCRVRPRRGAPSGKRRDYHEMRRIGGRPWQRHFRHAGHRDHRAGRGRAW